jgi:hypothetical protein
MPRLPGSIVPSYFPGCRNVCCRRDSHAYREFPFLASRDRNQPAAVRRTAWFGSDCEYARPPKSHSFWMFGLLLATSILAGVNAVSLPNFFCLATVLTLLSGVCFYRTRRPWQRFFRAAISLCGTPLRWVLVGVIAYRLYRSKLRKTPDWRLADKRSLSASPPRYRSF